MSSSLNFRFTSQFDSLTPLISCYKASPMSKSEVLSTNHLCIRVGFSLRAHQQARHLLSTTPKQKTWSTITVLDNLSNFLDFLLIPLWVYLSKIIGSSFSVFRFNPARFSSTYYSWLSFSRRVFFSWILQGIPQTMLNY